MSSAAAPAVARRAAACRGSRVEAPARSRSPFVSISSSSARRRSPSDVRNQRVLGKMPRTVVGLPDVEAATGELRQDDLAHVLVAAPSRVRAERSGDVLDRASHLPVGESLLGRVVERGGDGCQCTRRGHGLGSMNEDLLDLVASAPVAARGIHEAERAARQELEEPELDGLCSIGAGSIAEDERLRSGEIPAVGRHGAIVRERWPAVNKGNVKSRSVGPTRAGGWPR